MSVDIASLDFFVDELLRKVKAKLVSLVLNINFYNLTSWVCSYDEWVEEV